MRQKFTFEVDKVIHIIRYGGEDELHLSQENSTILAKAIGEKRASEVYDNRFHVVLKCSKGFGVNLAEALGLTITETIKIPS
jgi:hypothetical protein